MFRHFRVVLLSPCAIVLEKKGKWGAGESIAVNVNGDVIAKADDKKQILYVVWILNLGIRQKFEI